MAIRDHDHAVRCNKRRGLLSGALLFLLCPALARAADFPARTVTIIAPVPTGGATDFLARLIAQALSERLGKPVVVENYAGAGGVIGTGIAARAKADGHTLFLGTSPLVMEQVLRANPGYDLERDFAPVALVAESPLVLVASPSLGIKTVSELLALARQHQGQLAYASFGSGTHSHLAGEMLKAVAKVDLLHVPYQGGSPALLAVIGGQVAAGFVTPLVAMGNIRAGKVAALAVTGSRRLPALPGVPTLAESGVSGIDLDLWAAFLVPAGTPREIIARLSKEIVAVLQSPGIVRSIEEQGAIVVARGPDEVSRRMRFDFVAYPLMVKAVNLKVDE
jgi:tripartite-type tricarboxylate transporter receptor subunit TctC